MIILDDADIFDDLSASRLNPVKEKPDFSRLQWIETVPGLQTWISVPPTVPETNPPPSEPVD